MSEVLSEIIKYVDDVWAHYDTDGSGELNDEEFRKLVADVYDHYKLNTSGGMIEKALGDFDGDGNGTICRAEAENLVKRCWTWSHVYAVWSKLGKADDEALSKRQFRVFARSCLDSMGFGSDWHSDELATLMTEYDADGDGEVDLDETINFVYSFIEGAGLAVC